MKHFESVLTSLLVLVGILFSGNLFAQTAWNGAALTTGMATSTKPIYLYNVGAHAFLVNGASWGTEAALNADYGMPIIEVVNYTVDNRGSSDERGIRLRTDLKTNEGQYLTMFATDQNVNVSVFCDGDLKRGDGLVVMQFEPVAGSTNNEYYIHFKGNTQKTEGYINRYMAAMPLEGNSKKGDVYASLTNNDDFSKWIIITTDEIETLLTKSPADLDNPVNITYKLSDPNLDRGNKSQVDWKMVNWNQWTETVSTVTAPVSGRKYRIGYRTGDEYWYMTLASNGTLGRTRNAKDAAVWTVGGSTGRWTFKCNDLYLSRNVLTNAVTSETPTEWVVNSNGISNATFGRLEYILGQWWVTFNIWDSNNAFVLSESMAPKANNGLKLGVQELFKTRPDSQGESSCAGNTSDAYRSKWGKYFGAEANGVYGKFQQQIKVNYTGWYVVSCQGFYHNEDEVSNEVVSLFATVDGDTRRQFLSFGDIEGEVPADWHAAAEQLFPGTRYSNAVMFFVDMKTASGYSATGKTITIGLEWDEENSNVGDWTVFDDFQLEFLGDNNNLVLEENTLDYDYLTQTTETYKNATLLLNRMFTENAWNTLVLPVNLTKKQFLTAFGANARIADMVKVKDGVLSFVTIEKKSKRDDDILLQANKPYIVYIEHNPAVTVQYEASLNKADGTGFIKKAIGGPDAPYYMVPRVTLDKANLDGVDSYTFEDGDDASITLNGTLVKTYEGDKIRDGFDDMVGKIIFKGGKLWWLDKEYGMKAYRGWLEPMGYGISDDTSAGAKISFEIDGIEDDATYIRDLFVGGESEATPEKFANGIYSINGMNMGATSVENLPKGIYIVNGKKYIVK